MLIIEYSLGFAVYYMDKTAVELFPPNNQLWLIPNIQKQYLTSSKYHLLVAKNVLHDSHHF